MLSDVVPLSGKAQVSMATFFAIVFYFFVKPFKHGVAKTIQPSMDKRLGQILSYKVQLIITGI
jgi:hypothetical protein